AGLAAGAVTPLGTHALEAAQHFTDRNAYAALVLDHQPLPAVPPEHWVTTTSSVVWGLISTIGSFALAAALLVRTRLADAALGRLGERTTIQQVAPLAEGGVGAVSFGAGANRLPVEEIYRRTAPGVVQITATSKVSSPSDPFNVLPRQPQVQNALGSGFVIDK